MGWSSHLAGLSERGYAASIICQVQLNPDVRQQATGLCDCEAAARRRADPDLRGARNVITAGARASSLGLGALREADPLH